MLLTADIGNTNIVLALLDHGDRVVSQRRIPSGEVLPLAAYEDAVRQVLAGHDAPEGAVIGSVVPRLTEETARAIRSVTAACCPFSGRKRKGGGGTPQTERYRPDCPRRCAGQRDSRNCQ